MVIVIIGEIHVIWHQAMCCLYQTETQKLLTRVNAEKKGNI